MGMAGGRTEGTSRAARRRNSILRRSGSAFILLLSLLLLLSLVTWTPPSHTHGNVLGTVGRVVAKPILSGLGFGAFALTGLVVFWLGASLFGKRASRWWLAGAGIFIVTLCTAAMLDLTLDGTVYRQGGLEGPGGVAGAGLANRLDALSGSTGAVLFCLGALAAGLIAATDGLALVLAKDLADVSTRTGRQIAEKLPGAAKTIEKGVRSLAPALSALRPHRDAAVAKPPASRRPAPAPTVVERPAPAVEEPVADEEDLPDEDEEDGTDEENGARTLSPRPRTQAKKATPRPRRNPVSQADPRRTNGKYQFPGLDLLDPVKLRDPRDQEAQIQANAEILEETLRDFKVDAEVVAHCIGPVVTLYELDLAAGVKVNRIHNLAEDLAVALRAPSVRVVAPLLGKNTIGVEVPNAVRDDVRLRSLLNSETFGRNPGYLPLFLGTDVAGNPIIEDLTSMPHVLIAGATGSGKSVCINSVLVSLLLTRTPEQVRLILIDPKQVELAFFSKVPHLMSPVVTNMKKALGVLEWLVDQMEQRYALFHTMEVRNISSYNDLGPKKIRERKKEIGIAEEDEQEGLGFPDQLPYVVIVVDELADLMMVAGKEIESLITRLAQKSRAVGIHIVLATQRPSTDVITGLIKANMPCRVSFQVASKIDSRVILDQNGADKLLGRGDMLYLPPRTSHLVRSQGTFVSDGEVKRVAKFLSTRVEQKFEPSLEKAQTSPMIQNEEKDPLFEEAVGVILGEQRGSASLLQRALGVGYTRGSRIMDQMHKEGLVGPYKGSKAREVLMTFEEYQALQGAR
jgi:DNA segregation ATPase FtsK/SpoIIIE, S-DNA-T family